MMRSGAHTFLFMTWIALMGFGWPPHVDAQEIMRLEIEAENLAVPYYTIPVANHGIVVFRGADTRTRRISAWELIHYNVGFNEVHRQTINMERGGYFAGWKSDNGYIHLLFLNDQPLTSGEVIIYIPETRMVIRRPFALGDLPITDPVFRASGDRFYLMGIHRPVKSIFKRWVSPSGKGADKPLLISVSGAASSDSAIISQWPVQGLKQIAHAAKSPADASILVALTIDSAKYKRSILVASVPHDGAPLLHIGMMPLTPDLYLSDLTFVTTEMHPLACAGTYGSRDKRSWNTNDPIAARGFFFAPLNHKVTSVIRGYPFTRLRQNMLTPSPADRSVSRQRGGESEIRVLLHPLAYSQNKNLILVGETYFPEYEYENRAQHYYMPHSYYGYYPGFYDSGGRWVFAGFRYRTAVVIAFDPEGNLVWENGIETSNILDKQLMTRLSLMSYADELVLVYAHDGRIWFRVIRGSEVLVDKESYPVELPAPGDRIKENISMNMARWYDNYFLVWGRHVVRNAEGRNRTVYFCNKLAFE